MEVRTVIHTSFYYAETGIRARRNNYDEKIMSKTSNDLHIVSHNRNRANLQTHHSSYAFLNKLNRQSLKNNDYLGGTFYALGETHQGPTCALPATYFEIRHRSHTHPEDSGLDSYPQRFQTRSAHEAFVRY